MNRNNGYLEYCFDSKYEEVVLDQRIKLIDRNKTSFYLDDGKLFFKEEENVYYELIGTKICKYLGINYVEYDLMNVIFNDRCFKGVVSKNFKEIGYEVINYANIIDDYLKDNKCVEVSNDMNLEFIYNVLSYRYRDYMNKELIVNRIMDELITYFLVDILIMNYDNGKYNRELMENNMDSKSVPYYDYDHIFGYSNTRISVSDKSSNDIYDNLYELLSKCNDDYLNKFINMYNILSPNKLEEIFIEIENDIDSKIPDNLKNMLFLIYSIHYQKIGNVLISLDKGRIRNK